MCRRGRCRGRSMTPKFCRAKTTTRRDPRRCTVVGRVRLLDSGRCGWDSHASSLICFVMNFQVSQCGCLVSVWGDAFCPCPCFGRRQRQRLRPCWILAFSLGEGNPLSQVLRRSSLMLPRRWQSARRRSCVRAGVSVVPGDRRVASGVMLRAGTGWGCSGRTPLSPVGPSSQFVKLGRGWR